jgi:hypothetical protein
MLKWRCGSRQHLATAEHSRGRVAGLSDSERVGVLRHRWQIAKVYVTSEPRAYEPLARESFGLLREAWERGVSEVLLNGVVERYRPSIQTKLVAPTARYPGVGLQGRRLGKNAHGGFEDTTKPLLMARHSETRRY